MYKAKAGKMQWPLQAPDTPVQKNRKLVRKLNTIAKKNIIAYKKQKIRYLSKVFRLL